MITALIREAESYGVVIEILGENLELTGWKQLPPSLLDQIKAHKVQIIELLQKDKMARSYGFLILQSGEAYEAPYSRYSSVFVMIEGDKWDAWRETWQKGRAKSISCRSIIEQVSFELAMLKAKQYLSYVTSPKHKKEMNRRLD